MEIQIKVAGWLLIILAVSHLVLPAYFNWAKELRSISLINKEIMYVHTLFIGLMVLLMGLLCVSSSAELVNTRLGNKITLGIGVFWLIRLVIQFVGYSSSHWKGRRFETTAHIFCSLLWVYFSGVFLGLYFLHIRLS